LILLRLIWFLLWSALILLWRDQRFT